MHYLTFVLTETGQEEEIEIVMERYDENLEVAPYETECWCRGQQAAEEIRANPPSELVDLDHRCRQAGEAVGELRGLLHQISKENSESSQDPEALRDKLDQAISKSVALDKQRRAIRDGLQQAHPLANTPNSDCEECSGGGSIETTMNPNGRWDWFEVGGRWDGALEDNCQPVAEVRRLIEEDDAGLPFAVITASEWRDLSGVYPEKRTPEEGKKDLLEVLERHQGMMVSVVDCHA